MIKTTVVGTMMMMTMMMLLMAVMLIMMMMVEGMTLMLPDECRQHKPINDNHPR